MYRFRQLQRPGSAPRWRLDHLIPYRVDSLAGGVIAGMLAATIVDSVVLPYEPVPATPTVQPLVSVAKDRLWLGAGGTF